MHNSEVFLDLGRITTTSANRVAVLRELRTQLGLTGNKKTEKEGIVRLGSEQSCPYKRWISVGLEKAAVRLRIQCPKGVQVQILFPAPDLINDLALLAPGTA